MNRIFKVIWSQTRQKYVVVSELVKNGGWVLLSSTQKIALGLAAACMLAVPFAAQAGVVYDTGSNPVLIVNGSAITPSASSSGIALGGATISGGLAVAIGNNSSASAWGATAVGNGAKASRGSVAFGLNADATSSDAAQVNATAIGRDTQATAVNATALGAFAKALGAYTTAIGAESSAIGNYSVVQGYMATARGDYSLAVGPMAKVDGGSSIAIGKNASALSRDNAIVIGTDTKTWHTADRTLREWVNAYVDGGSVNVLHTGSNTPTSYVYAGDTANGDSVIAIGTKARALLTDSIGIGNGARADSKYSVAIGTETGSLYGYKASDNKYALGSPADASYSVTIGYKSKSFASNGDETYFANAFNSIAIGTNVHTHAAYTVAIGTATDATGERSFALGTTSTNNGVRAHFGSRTGGQGSIAIGDGALTWSDLITTQSGDIETARDLNVNDSIAIGTLTRARGLNTVVIGGAVSRTDLVPVYSGDLIVSYSPVTTYGFNKDGTKVEQGGFGDMGVEGAHTGQKADAAIAIGGASQTLGTNAARSLREGGIAIGSGALVSRRDIDLQRTAILSSPAYKNALIARDNAWGVWQPYAEGELTPPPDPITLKPADFGEPEPQREKFPDDESYNTAHGEWVTASTDYYNSETYVSAYNAYVTASNDYQKDLADFNNKYNAASRDYHTADANFETIRAEIREKLNVSAKPINAVAIGTSATAEVQGSVALGSYSIADVSLDRSGNVTGLTGYDPLTGTNYDGRAKEGGVWKSVFGSVSVGRAGNADIALSGDQTYKLVGDSGAEYQAYILSDDKKYYEFTSADLAAERRVYIKSLTDPTGKTYIDATDFIKVTRRISNVAAGVYDTDAVNVAQLKRATSMDADNRAVTMKRGDDSGIIASPYLHIEGISAGADETTYAQALGDNAVAIGQNTLAANRGSLAIGTWAQARGDHSIAVGTGSFVIGQGSGAFGTTDGDASGKGNFVYGNYSYAVGMDNNIGHELKAENGFNGYDTDNNNAIKADGTVYAADAGTRHVFVFGEDNTISHKGHGLRLNVFGENNTIAFVKRSTIIGNDNLVGNPDQTFSSEADVNMVRGAIVIGNDSSVSDRSRQVVAIGNDSVVNSQRGVAVGETSIMLGDNSVAMGYGSYVGSPELKTKYTDLIAAREDYVEKSNTFDIQERIYNQAVSSRDLAAAVFQTFTDEKDRLAGIASDAGKAKDAAQSVFNTTEAKLIAAQNKVSDLQDEYDDLNDDLSSATGAERARIEAQMEAKSADWRVAVGAVDVAQRDHNGAEEALTVATNNANAATEALTDFTSSDAYTDALTKLEENQEAVTQLLADGSAYQTASADMVKAREDYKAAELALRTNAVEKDRPSGSVAIGNMSLALNSNVVAVGSLDIVAGESSIAIGNGGQVQGDRSTALGAGNMVAASNSNAIGNANKVGRLTLDTSYLAPLLTAPLLTAPDGTTQYAFVFGQSNDVGTASGNVKFANVIGTYNTVSSDSEHVNMMGVSNDVAANYAVAIGYKNQVTGNNSIAIGKEHKVAGENSGAFGDPNEVAGSDSYAFGNTNKIGKIEYEGDGENKTLKADSTTTNVHVVGNNNTVGASGKTVNTAVVGHNNTFSSVSDVYVLGSGVTAVTNDSVFLGSGSAFVASDDKTTAGVNEYSKADIGTHELKFAGGKADGVVAVGSGSKVRRIQGVAAGLISKDSTDAINGSQLYAMMDASTLETDNRAVGLSVDAETGRQEIRSPYININGVADAVDDADMNGYANAAGVNSIAIGASNDVSGDHSAAVGINNKIANDSSLTKNSYVYGANNTVASGDLMMAEDLVVVGTGNSIATGDFASVTSASILGHGNVVAKDGAFVRNTSVVGVSNDIATNGNITDASIIGNDNVVAKDAPNLTSGKLALLGYSNTIANGGAVQDLSLVGSNNTIVTADNAGVFGNGNTASSFDNSVIVGSNNTVTSFDSSAVIGHNNNIPAGELNKKVFILGSNVTNVTSNSVFLGDGSNFIGPDAVGDHSFAKTAGVGTYDSPYAVGSVSYANNFAQQEALGVVAVGNRRIQGVAAGLVSQDSTDAINGSQLYQAYENLQWRVSVTSSDGGAVTNPIAADQRHVIGTYTDSKNNGNVGFVAGYGMNIAVESGNALNMTFAVRSADAHTHTSGSVTVADGTESGQFWDATQVQNAVNDSSWAAKDAANASFDVHPGGDVTFVGQNGIVVSADNNNDEKQIRFSLNSGMVYSGDFGESSAISLDKHVNVIGNAENSADLTDKNIGVVSSKDADGNAVLVVKLNKDLKLGENGSVVIDNALSLDKTGIEMADNTQISIGDTVTLTSSDLTINGVDNEPGTVVSGGNITVGNTISIDASSGITVKAVSGNVVINESGIDAGSNKIVNVADGEISQTSHEAINGSQLYTAYRALEWSADVSANGGVVNNPISEQRISAEEANKGKLSFKAGPGIVISADNNNVFGMTFGVNKADDPTVSGGSIDVPPSSDVYWDANQVASAVNDIYWTAKDGNGGETPVKPGGSLTIQGGTNVSVSNTAGVFTVDLGENVATRDDGMVYSGDFGETVSLKLNETLTVAGNASAAEDLTENNIGVVTDTQNKKLVVKLNKDLDLTEDGSITIGDTKVTNNNVTVGDTTVTNEGLTVGDTSVTNEGLTVGDTTVTNEGLTINNGPSVTNTGIDAGGMKITNVSSGDVSEGSTDAVNGSQLWKAMQEAGGSWYLAAGENADSESVEVSKGNTVKFIVGDQPEDSDNLFIAPDDKDKKTVKFTIKENPTFAGQVTATGGFNASGKKIVNVAEGDVNENSTEAINGSQLFSVAKAIGGKVENNKVSFNVTMKADANNTNGVKKNYSNVADALNAADDTLYNMTQHFTTKQLTVEGNSDFRGDVTVGGSFTAKGPALFKEEVTMEKGLNMSNSKIRGLADGEADDEAVNMGQLKAMGNRLSSGMGDMYNTLNKDIRQVGSRAAALAGLHAPMYRPERRTGFNAALGFYRGDTTLAMGLTHYFSEDSMISAAATVGHKPMVNVGWSVRLGRGDMVIKTTRRRVDEHEVRNADLEARVQELEKRLGVSPKVDHHPEKITGRVPLDQRVSDLEMSAAPVSAKSDVDAKLDEILKKRAARKRRSGK